MSNKREISCKNSEQLLRKWRKTLGDIFLPHTVELVFVLIKEDGYCYHVVIIRQMLCCECESIK